MAQTSQPQAECKMIWMKKNETTFKLGRSDILDVEWNTEKQRKIIFVNNRADTLMLKVYIEYVYNRQVIDHSRGDNTRNINSFGLLHLVLTPLSINILFEKLW